MVTEFSSPSEASVFHEKKIGLSKNPLLELVVNKTDGTPKSIKDYLAGLSFVEFSEIVSQTNAYFRGIDGAHTFDGVGILSDGYLPPKLEIRIELLKEAFEKAMLENTQEKCAFVIGMSFLTIHPYLNANGRTSRTLFALLAHGYSGSDADIALFSEIGDTDNGDDETHTSSSLIDLDPGNSDFGPSDRKTRENHSLAKMIYDEMWDAIYSKRYGDTEVDIPLRVGFSNRDRTINDNSQLSPDEQGILMKMFGSGVIAYYACMSTFSDDILTKTIKTISFKEERYSVISYQSVVEKITQEEFEKLRLSFQDLTIEYIRRLMDVTAREDFSKIYEYYIRNFKAFIENK